MIVAMREQAEKDLIHTRNLIKDALDSMYKEDAFPILRTLRASISSIGVVMNTLENDFEVSRKEKER